MSDFVERAEKALEPIPDGGTAWRRVAREKVRQAHIEQHLREAITEVRERDERISGKDFAIDELRVALKEENSACKRLEAENAKLREMAQDADRKAEVGIRMLGAAGKHKLLKDVRRALRAALGPDAPGDAS